MNRSKWWILFCAGMAMAWAIDNSSISWAEDPKPGEASCFFKEAKPIWPRDRQMEMNLTVGFRCVIDNPGPQAVVLRLTGSTLYRVFVNGEFVHHGPARGPHGYFRVDELNITDRLRSGDNVIAIEVVGYNINSYYVLDQPSFLQAEIGAGDRVLAATGPDQNEFQAILLPERIQKVPRYSFQRAFMEAYRLQAGYDAWRKNVSFEFTPAEIALSMGGRLLPRRVAYPEFKLRTPINNLSTGMLQKIDLPDKPWEDRALSESGRDPQIKGYAKEELEIIPPFDVQTLQTASREPINRTWDNAPIEVTQDRYGVLDMGTNLTGLIGAKIICRQPTRLFFVFDEILKNDDVDFTRLNCNNIIDLELSPGQYEFETIEPYTFRYLKWMCSQGDCTLESVHLREVANPDVHEATFSCNDPELMEIFEAGRETFRQNAVDIFMDCPSRERAGWLCDSFFTARTALELSGDTRVEKNFLKNYMLPDRFEHHPAGMLPMCYPSDHLNGTYIPNWSLWFILELDEYLQRSGDRELVEQLRDKVTKLLDYFIKYENDQGLLEKLDSWIFIEWSKANKFVQDVNFPTNMLYAQALITAGELYQMPDWINKGLQLREIIRRLSFDGQFFVDNAVRTDGRLTVTTNRTEVCQYFAFYFQVADLKTYDSLWQLLQDQFGPNRNFETTWPEIHPANALIGNCLRMELLARYGLRKKLKEEIKDFLLFMARRTGTLWEHKDEQASCNHGFASHAVHVFYRDMLGIDQIDVQNKRIRIRFSDVGLNQCSGQIPLDDGPIRLQWRIEDDKLFYQLQYPKAYSLSVINDTGLTCIDESELKQVK